MHLLYWWWAELGGEGAAKKEGDRGQQDAPGEDAGRGCSLSLIQRDVPECD